MSDEIRILTAPSTTKLADRHRGQVLIGGSHGGVYPAYLAARAGVRAVILSDAGIGKDGAGIASLDYLDALSLPAATVSHASARIADGDDQLARGVISHVNQAAAALGCAAGQSCAACAALLRAAKPWRGEPPAYREARFLLRAAPGEAEVWGLDSVALMGREDKGRIVVTGSHGALLGGRPDGLVKGPPLAAVFNDAGVGIERIGISRLAVLAELGVAAATVAADSARIGDARSAWETGRLSYLNALAEASGAAMGDSVPAFAERISAARGSG